MSATRSVAHAVRLACAVLTLLALAAPCALGTAMGPVLRELGAMDQHVCKCGMAPGKCGCPECARLEHERRMDHSPSPVPVLKGHCDDDAPAMPLGAPLPSGTLAAASILLPARLGDRLPVPTMDPFLSSLDDEPPTPPPRIATV